jgi:hypothetical protein
MSLRSIPFQSAYNIQKLSSGSAVTMVTNLVLRRVKDTTRAFTRRRQKAYCLNPGAVGNSNWKQVKENGH